MFGGQEKGNWYYNNNLSTQYFIYHIRQVYKDKRLGASFLDLFNSVHVLSKRITICSQVANYTTCLFSFLIKLNFWWFQGQVFFNNIMKIVYCYFLPGCCFKLSDKPIVLEFSDDFLSKYCQIGHNLGFWDQPQVM